MYDILFAPGRPHAGSPEVVQLECKSLDNGELPGKQLLVHVVESWIPQTLGI